MSFGFDELQTVLGIWPVATDWSEKADDSLLDRIFQLLSAAQTQPSDITWHADLQPLLCLPIGGGPIGQVGLPMGWKRWKRDPLHIC